MKTSIGDGRRLTLTAGGTLTSGSPLLFGAADDTFCIPFSDAESGDVVAVETDGEHLLNKVFEAIADTAHTAGESISAGDRLYADLTNDVLTKKPLGPFIGVATAAAGSSAEKVRVALRPATHQITGWTCGYLSGADGLAVGSHDLLGGTIPAGATVLRYVYRVVGADDFTSPTADGATIALGHADDPDAIKVATAISSGTTWDVEVNAVQATAAAAAPTTAERAITATVAVEATSASDTMLIVYVEWALLGSFA